MRRPSRFSTSSSHRDAGARRDADVGEAPVDARAVVRPHRTKSAASERQRREPDRRRPRGRAEPTIRAASHIASAGDEDGEPAAGRHQGFSATGTGTSARISCRTTSVERPLMTASAVTMMRWASTGTASAFTSSGIT